MSAKYEDAENCWIDGLERVRAAGPELLHACLLVTRNAPILAQWIKENDPTAFAQVCEAIKKAGGG